MQSQGNGGNAEGLRHRKFGEETGSERHMFPVSFRLVGKNEMAGGKRGNSTCLGDKPWAGRRSQDSLGKVK